MFGNILETYLFRRECLDVHQFIAYSISMVVALFTDCSKKQMNETVLY